MAVYLRGTERGKCCEKNNQKSVVYGEVLYGGFSLAFFVSIVICVGLEIFIFLEHTVWIGYNLDAAEQNRDFSRVLVMTVGMVVLLAFHQLCSSIYFYWSTTKYQAAAVSEAAGAHLWKSQSCGHCLL